MPPGPFPDETPARDDEFDDRPLDRIKIRFTYTGDAEVDMSTDEARKLFGLGDDVTGEELTLAIGVLTERVPWSGRMAGHISNPRLYNFRDFKISDAETGEPLYPEL